MIKSYNTKLEHYVAPAILRKCKGIVIEAVSGSGKVQPILDKARENGYNIYYLRHSENDWSTPHTISFNPVLVNRFGWFITKDNMNFKNHKDKEIELKASINSEFFNVLNDDEAKLRGTKVISLRYFEHCKSFDILSYVTNDSYEKEIWKLINTIL